MVKVKAKVKKPGAKERRQQIRNDYWKDDTLWTGEEDGWFKSPRTMPLVLSLLSSKEIGGKQDPSRVYFELLSRHMGEGVIEMASELDHAYASGYEGQRALRTWQERMAILELHGFIKKKQVGNQQYKYVALVHPTVAVQKLYEKKQVPEIWWGAYCSRKAETKEPTYEQLMKRLANKEDEDTEEEAATEEAEAKT